MNRLRRKLSLERMESKVCLTTVAFATTMLHLTGFDFEGRITALDVNGDGHLDLFASGHQDDAEGAFLLSQPDGQGFKRMRVPGKGNTYGVPVDLDNDGDYDVLFGNGWQENPGDFVFADERRVRVRDPNLYHGTFPAIHDNRAIDVDSDGLVDVVFGYLADPNHTRPRLGWLKNTGERNWLDHTTLADVRPISEPGDTSAIYWVDVDNDGHMDLATSGWPLISGMVWHRHLDGLGTFASPEPLFNPSDISDWGAWKGQFVDLNGDGFPDYVVSVRGWQERDPTRDVLGWYPNQGDGTFGDFITIVSRAPSSSDVFFGRNTGAFGFGDIDGDGDLDIVAVIVVGPEVTNLYWFENQGGGSSFLRHELTNTSYSTWREMNFVIVDFNGDGDMDIIGGGLADYESYFEQRVMGDANGDGRFDSADLVQVFQAGEYEDGIHLNSTFATGDWNGDFEFTSRDLVWAFQAGNYQGAAAPALAPSPTTSMLADIAFAVQSQEQHALRVGQPLDRTRTASAKRAYVP